MGRGKGEIERPKEAEEKKKTELGSWRDEADDKKERCIE